MKRKRTAHQEFFVAENSDVDSVLQHLGEVYKVRDSQENKARERYYDTFDWCLYAKGYLLKQIGKFLYLTTTDEQVVAEEIAPSAEYFFYWHLADGPMRQLLQPVTDIRAVSEILFIRKNTTAYDLLNKDGKTVTRLSYRQDRVSGNGAAEQTLLPTLHFLKVKGYDKPYARALQAARDAGLKEAGINETPFLRGLHAIGREVFDYSSSFNVNLERDITIREALRRIGLNLIDSMEANYPGVLKDIDSEYLHDFRVAVRRTRSFLGQMKKYFPSERVTFFQQEFKWLGNITGPVRDLDVYLLTKQDFLDKLPEQLHTGMHAFFDDLAKERVASLEEMIQGLKSSRYKELVRQWRAFVTETGEDEEWEFAAQPCYPAAVKRIRKRYAKMVKEGEAINNDSQDKDLHSLRIDGKKLRYLLEFFSSFFDEADIQFFRKQLKKLQNNLGDFNDISVQLKMLEHHHEGLTGRSKRSVNIAAAIGGLVTRLSEEKEELRRRFEKVFTAFASEKNQKRFKAAFTK